MNEKLLLLKLLRHFYFQGPCSLAYQGQEDVTIGELGGRELEKELIDFLSSQGVVEGNGYSIKTQIDEKNLAN